MKPSDIQLYIGVECRISFVTRDGESDEIFGTITGEIDTWGKYTVQSGGKTYYLFADEFFVILLP